MLRVIVNIFETISNTNRRTGILLAFYDKNVKANVEENVFSSNELNKILPNQT